MIVVASNCPDGTLVFRFSQLLSNSIVCVCVCVYQS